MQILPVLDITSRQVVRGIAGQRSRYQPVVSKLCQGSTPLVVARAFREFFVLHRLYLADLDAIAGRQPAFDLYQQLADDGFDLLVDAGLRTASEIAPLFEAGVETVIAGLETVRSPGDLGEMISLVGPDRLVFSLDMKDGRPLGRDSAWLSSPEEILESTWDLGVRQVLLLDLARVGVGEGLGTEPLAGWALEKWPQIKILLGGGVRGPQDLARLESLGVGGILIGSALHDGRITPADINGDCDGDRIKRIRGKRAGACEKDC